MSRVAAGVPEAEEPAERGSGLKRMVASALSLLFLLVVLGGCESTSTNRAGSVSDRAIVAQIRTLISDNPSLNGGAIRVFAQAGNVTLSGPVPDADTKSRVLERVRSLEGVKSVSDNLELPH